MLVKIVGFVLEPWGRVFNLRGMVSEFEKNIQP